MLDRYRGKGSYELELEFEGIRVQGFESIVIIWKDCRSDVVSRHFGNRTKLV